METTIILISISLAWNLILSIYLLGKSIETKRMRETINENFKQVKRDIRKVQGRVEPFPLP